MIQLLKHLTCYGISLFFKTFYCLCFMFMADIIVFSSFFRLFFNYFRSDNDHASGSLSAHLSCLELVKCPKKNNNKNNKNNKNNLRKNELKTKNNKNSSCTQSKSEVLFECF